MRYFVGYLIEGEAAYYYNYITTELSEKFHIKNLSERIQPHFTIKPPFESDNIEEFKKLLSQITADQKVFPICLKNFGRYSTDSPTFFISGNALKNNLKQIETIVDQLEPYGNNKKSLFKRPITLHCSVARHLLTEQSEEIWNYLQTLPPPQFDLKFDNLAFFRWKNTHWEIDEIFRFKDV
jgi:2'-5' RNA ligase